MMVDTHSASSPLYSPFPMLNPPEDIKVDLPLISEESHFSVYH